MAKKRNEEVDSGNATEKDDANTNDDFVVQQPSLLGCVQQKIR